MRGLWLVVVMLVGCFADESDVPRPPDSELHMLATCSQDWEQNNYFDLDGCELPCAAFHNPIQSAPPGECAASYTLPNGYVRTMHCGDWSTISPSVFTYKGVKGCCDIAGSPTRAYFAVCDGE